MSEVIIFDVLEGHTMTSVTATDNVMTFTRDDGKVYVFDHAQDCSESVYIEDVCGDLADLVGSPLLTAEEATNPDPKKFKDVHSGGSQTWTFYKFATVKGSVTVRWLGESNGYYSERVDFHESRKRSW